ncbi:hypothetical protein RSOLAG22IIIB_08048 [Rhizoctonia solani]|uniref:Protein kinase domain-containing protein n=1 Tax=Rhizoctonia solani TaxID=456999 RepID=A0A0K6FR60_9AGAM|nr:hypothetical protein RSOLAG22IIIB_08048 [Rhizoctonia solani]
MQENLATPEGPAIEENQVVNDQSREVQVGNLQAEGASSNVPKSKRPQLVRGQRIMAKMLIPPDALRPVLKSSNYREKIERGEEVPKLAYVLKIKEDGIIVVYATTIGKKTSLEEHVNDTRDWYPIRPKREILTAESLALVLKAINPDATDSTPVSTNEDIIFHQSIQDLEGTYLAEHEKHRFWQGHIDFKSQSAEFWYTDQDQDFYVNIVHQPGTLAHAILVGKADLPEYGKHLCISGDNVTAVSSPPARPSAMEDHEDCSEDLIQLQLIEVDETIHSTKFASCKSEIQALLKLKDSTRIIHLLGRSADNKLVFPKYKQNLLEAVAFHPVPGKLASIKKWMLEIIDAVAELHEAEIIHQDLTLQNILDNEPLVLCNLRPGNSSSTYPCRAPEILERDTADYSAASDIYALGYCLRDMCYANFPFTPFGDHLVPEPFDKVFEACTRKAPQDRPLLKELRDMVRCIELKGPM